MLVLFCFAEKLLEHGREVWEKWQDNRIKGGFHSAELAKPHLGSRLTHNQNWKYTGRQPNIWVGFEIVGL